MSSSEFRTKSAQFRARSYASLMRPRRALPQSSSLICLSVTTDLRRSLMNLWISPSHLNHPLISTIPRHDCHIRPYPLEKSVTRLHICEPYVGGLFLMKKIQFAVFPYFSDTAKTKLV